MTTDNTTPARNAVQAYLATWNATCEEERRRLLKQHWAPDVNYVDPLAAVGGQDDISTVIAGAHEQFPGFVFSLVGEVDAHHNQLRFRWGLAPEGAEPVVIGFDVLVLDHAGRIHDVRGFLDQVPAATRPVGQTPCLAYVIAHLHEAAPHPQIAEYMERISGTFEPYGGRFLVHGMQHDVKEGDWPGHVVIIGFPGVVAAQTWWDSPAYQEIAPLRSRHIKGDIIVVEGVQVGYDPSALANAMREALAAT